MLSFLFSCLSFLSIRGDLLLHFRIHEVKTDQFWIPTCAKTETLLPYHLRLPLPFFLPFSTSTSPHVHFFTLTSHRPTKSPLPGKSDSPTQSSCPTSTTRKPLPHPGLRLPSSPPRHKSWLSLVRNSISLLITNSSSINQVNRGSKEVVEEERVRSGQAIC